MLFPTVLYALLFSCALSYCSPLVMAASAYGVVEPQISVPLVDQMPNCPVVLSNRNWKQTTLDFNKLAFNLNATGKYLPIVYLDNSQTNFPILSFGLPDYLGQKRGPGGETATSCVSAVLSATLAGVDESKGPHNWALMTEQFYNKHNGENVVLDGYTRITGATFWPELWPGMLFDGLAYYYPNVEGMDTIMHTSADRWYDATEALKDQNGIPQFNHTAFNLLTMKPVDNGVWTEPDAAADISYLEYLAYARYHDPKYLEAATACQAYMAASSKSLLIETGIPYGAYVAARMNAEQGTSLDDGKLIGWTFGTSDRSYKVDWGMLTGSWGGYAVDGLEGSVQKNSGYAFATETFSIAGGLVPLVRYDQRYARLVGKWLLNASNSAALFYPDALPKWLQSEPNWNGDPAHCIAYESLHQQWIDTDSVIDSPFAAGDPSNYGWGPSDLGIYGSAHSGFFGGIISPTNVPGVLRLDCLRTDYFRQNAYPTFLYYNPHSVTESIEVAVGAKRSDLYDEVTHRFVKRDVAGTIAVDLSPNSPMVLVTTPTGGHAAIRGHKLAIDGVVVDFRAKESS